jgi:hypothetical protein
VQLGGTAQDLDPECLSGWSSWEPSVHVSMLRTGLLIIAIPSIELISCRKLDELKFGTWEDDVTASLSDLLSLAATT